MKKKFGLILCVIMAVVFTMGVLGGCNKDNKDEEDEVHWPAYNPYHAESIYYSLKTSFLHAKENRIGAAYPNENYDPSDPSSEKYFYFFDYEGDESLYIPSRRIILLTEHTQLEEAFEKIPEIDLETKMVMIILYGSFGGERLYDIKIDNGILEAVIAKPPANGSSIPPILGKRVLEIDKMEITETKISYKTIKK